MVIKFSIHMSNRYKLKVTKFQSFIYFIKKVIKKKPLGGAESAPPPPPVLIGLRELIYAGIKFRDFMFLLSSPGVILCFWPI